MTSYSTESAARDAASLIKGGGVVLRDDGEWLVISIEELTELMKNDENEK